MCYSAFYIANGKRQEAHTWHQLRALLPADSLVFLEDYDITDEDHCLCPVNFEETARRAMLKCTSPVEQDDMRYQDSWVFEEPTAAN